jgi:hypothetical protein
LSKSISVRIGADKRTRLTWRKSNPATGTVYSLRWAW